jgi:hypothetical protein|tara:strand:- start:25381 stop:28092 length:2712 start_codon:yes stop_codon:yes gene_type:complete
MVTVVKYVALTLLLLITACQQDSGQTGSRQTGSRQTESALTERGDTPPGDYLSANLRARVERLKVEVSVAPPTIETIEDRIDVLWQWANAMARRDGGLRFAPNLTARVAQILGQLSGYDLHTNPDGSVNPDLVARALEGARRGNAIQQALIAYVGELTLREEEPEVFGKLTSADRGPFPAGSYQTIRQTWTVGSRNLQPGGYLMVAQHFMAAQGRYQVDDQQAANYVSIESSNPNAVFMPSTQPMRGMHGGFRRPADNLTFRLDSGLLTEGDTVTITYGDRRFGSPGFRIQAVSNDYYQLPVYLSFNTDPVNYLLDPTAFEVIGAEAAGVHGFVPSIVRVDEPFSLSVRVEDTYYNKASGPMPGMLVFSNDEPFAEIAAGNQAINRIDDIALADPGVYRFSFQSLDGSISGVSNPVWVQQDPPYRIYWGDTHGHSGFAEGQGTPEGFFRFGRDEARLDFLTLSEHDIWLDDGEWERMRKTVQEFNSEGEFIAYLGYEWTVQHRRGGHHNVLYRTPEARERVGVQFHPILFELYSGLRDRYQTDDVLIIPHAHQAGYWHASDGEMETLVEIHSQHGYFEWFGHMYLQQGFNTGFIAASDDHLGHPGYTSVRPSGFIYQGGLAAVRAGQKTSDALFTAMKQRKTYATSVDRIILSMDVNGTEMGGVTAPSPIRTIKGQVMGTSAIDTITVVKNGRIVAEHDYRVTQQLTGDFTHVELTFHSPSHSAGYQHDNPRAWRIWKGNLTVSGASVVEIKPGYHNPLLPPTYRDDEEPNRVHFALGTRGEKRRLLLTLQNVSDKSAIAVHLDQSREMPTAPARLRPPKQLPAADFRFSMGDLEEGARVREFVVDEYTDQITLRTIRADAALDQEYRFEDREPAKPGDYYYVKVEQANSGIAWSSPVWLNER